MTSFHHPASPAPVSAPASLAELPLILTVTELAALLRISRGKTYAVVHSGQVRVLRIGGRLLVPRQSVEQLLAEGGTFA